MCIFFYINTPDRGRLLIADVCLSFAVVRHFKDSWSLAARLERGEVTDNSVEHEDEGDLICHLCHFLFYPTFFVVVLLRASFLRP